VNRLAVQYDARRAHDSVAQNGGHVGDLAPVQRLP
jgi:hypothetical protein